jgi:hypothetical protein
MKKKYCLFVSCMLAISLQAQITIDQADLPSPGEKIVRAIHTIDATDFTITGANHAWDFKNLMIASMDTLDYFNITSAPLFTQFVFNGFDANLKSQMYNNSPNPLNFPSIVSGFFAVDSSYSFIKKNATRFAKTGFSLKLNGIDLPLPYDANDVIYKLPFTYASVDSSNSMFDINIPLLPFFYYQQSQKRVNTVDGWGTLLLPNFTVPVSVLRLKSELYIVDTIRIDTGFVHLGLKTPRPKQVEYKWIAKGYDAPLLEVVGTELAGNFIATNIKFFPAPIAAAMNNTTKNTDIKIFPNPATNEVHFNTNENFDVQIINVFGQIMFTKQQMPLDYILDTKLWPSGIYNVIMQQKGKVFITEKLVIQ